jgi:hypothetical protein
VQISFPWRLTSNPFNITLPADPGSLGPFLGA